MKNSQKYPLETLTHVDEFTVGEKEEDKQGRRYASKKKEAVIGVELTDKNKIRRIYIKSIDDYSLKSLTPIFEEQITNSVKIVTDK